MDDQLALGDSLSLRILIVSRSSPNSALNINAFLCKMRTCGLSEVENLSANLSQNDLILKLSQTFGKSFWIRVSTVIVASLYICNKYPEKNDFTDCTTNQFYSDSPILCQHSSFKVLLRRV